MFICWNTIWEKRVRICRCCQRGKNESCMKDWLSYKWARCLNIVFIMLADCQLFLWSLLSFIELNPTCLISACIHATFSTHFLLNKLLSNCGSGVKCWVFVLLLFLKGMHLGKVKSCLMLRLDNVFCLYFFLIVALTIFDLFAQNEGKSFFFHLWLCKFDNSPSSY